MLGSLRCVLCAVVVGGCYAEPDQKAVPEPSGPAVAEASQAKLPLARSLYQRGQFDQALRVLQDVLIETPNDAAALRLCIDVYRSTAKYGEAAELATLLAQSDTRLAGGLYVQAFDLYLRSGDYQSAEDVLNRLLVQEPQNIQAHRLLAELLNAQGRRFESRQHVLQLIRAGSVARNEVLSLIDLSGPFLLVSYGDLVDSSAPSLFMLGDARRLYVASNSEPDQVLSMLRVVTESFPESVSASAFLGRVLLETGRLDEFHDWMAHLPSGMESHPEYWYAIGVWLATDDRHPEAIRAFSEAFRRDPTSRESLRSMIQSLEKLGNDSQAVAIREKLADLDLIFRTAKDADAEQALWISEKLQQFLRPWESVAWLWVAAQITGDIQRQIPELNRRRAAILAWERDLTVDRIGQARAQRVIGFNLDQWPMPKMDSRQVTVADASAVSSLSPVTFAETANDLGLRSQFDSGFSTDGGEFYAYQVNGGGIVVIDYDLDGRCDLYFNQSGGKPTDTNGSTPNQLFRLLPEMRFDEVTQASSTGDRGYGQGVCSGDVNQDGFPDLLVANIGPNTVYINQGDGTFREASRLISDDSASWTSSLGLGDLTGDHLPEIVEINYIDDPKSMRTRCAPKDYLICQPQRFDNAADHVYRCGVDGRYASWAEVSGRMRESPKLGFGLVIANFDRRNGNDFMVTNDGDLNHYWVSEAANASQSERFELFESANVRGCSVGRGGNSQASMGIASGDFNRDGTLDVHVTNFLNEPVNLYLQTRSGHFSDDVLKYRLFEPSFGVLGFGTQAVDLNNDGWLDLVVLNGHVFDARHEDLPFRMQPQVFLGSKQRFQLFDRELAGQYWDGEYLGRTLATVDFNRDGRIDLVANHLDAPVELLRNESAVNHWLQLELIGVNSERDAIGAEVRVEAGQEQWTAWVVGGDGYMCTSEPIVHVGLGTVDSIDRVTLHWPSGESQVLDKLQPNHRYLVIEGQPQAFERR